MTDWEFEVDGRRTVVGEAPQLEALLRAPETKCARVLALERVVRKRVPRWETAVYRMLGLRSPASEARGTIEVSVAGERAFVVFLRDDDDDGAVGITDHDVAAGRVEFVTAAGEKFFEAASCCVSRDQALAAMLAFMRSAKRPPGFKWVPVGKRPR